MFTTKVKLATSLVSFLEVVSNIKYKDVSIVTYIMLFEFKLIVDNVTYLNDNKSDNRLIIIVVITKPNLPKYFLDKYIEDIEIIKIQRYINMFTLSPSYSLIL